MNNQLQTQHRTVTSVFGRDGVSIGKVKAFPAHIKDRVTEISLKNLNRRVVLDEVDDPLDDFLGTNDLCLCVALRSFEFADFPWRFVTMHHDWLKSSREENESVPLLVGN